MNEINLSELWMWQAAEDALQTWEGSTQLPNAYWAYLFFHKSKIICQRNFNNVLLYVQYHESGRVKFCSDLWTKADIKCLQHVTFQYGSFNCFFIDVTRLIKPHSENRHQQTAHNQKSLQPINRKEGKTPFKCFGWSEFSMS